MVFLAVVGAVVITAALALGYYYWLGTWWFFHRMGEGFRSYGDFSVFILGCAVLIGLTVLWWIFIGSHIEIGFK